MISKTAEYGLRAVLHIAGSDTDQPVRANEIARELGVPANYLSKILHTLARAGVLTSGRGPRGGFRMAVPPEDLKLASIIATLDPGLLEESCLLGNPECSDHSSCAIHERWKQVKVPLMAFFQETTVAAALSGAVSAPSGLSAVRTNPSGEAS